MKVFFEALGLAVVLGVIIWRADAVLGSEEGLWQEYPHSGFTPDCPTWGKGGEW